MTLAEKVNATLLPVGHENFKLRTADLRKLLDLDAAGCGAGARKLNEAVLALGFRIHKSSCMWIYRGRWDSAVPYVAAWTPRGYVLEQGLLIF